MKIQGFDVFVLSMHLFMMKACFHVFFIDFNESFIICFVLFKDFDCFFILFKILVFVVFRKLAQEKL